MLFHLGAIWRLNEAGYRKRPPGSRASPAARSRAALGARWYNSRLTRPESRRFRRQAGRAGEEAGGYDRRPGCPRRPRWCRGRRSVKGSRRRTNSICWAARRCRRCPRREGPAVRYQRDQPPVGGRSGVLEALRSRLQARRARSAGLPARARGRRLVRLPAASLPGATRFGRRPGYGPRTAKACSGRPSHRRPSSPTEASTTTSDCETAWKGAQDDPDQRRRWRDAA